MTDSKKTTPCSDGGGGSAAGGTAASCPVASTPTGYYGEGGKTEISDSKCLVKTGVALKKDGSDTAYSDAIAITVKCLKTPHVVQFIYREIIGADGKPVEREMRTTGGRYKTTTDPKTPVWNTDSAGKPDPNYDSSGASRSDPGTLTIYDQPFLAPEAGETWRATFKAFTICDGKVTKVISWIRSQKHGESPTYAVAAEDAAELPAWAKQQLKDQRYDDAP